MTLTEPIGIIAGNGSLPFECAKAAKAQGLDVYVVAHRGETDPDLISYVTKLDWIKLGQLGKIINLFKKNKVKKVVFAGGIKRVNAFSALSLDWRALGMVARLRTFGDDALLRGIAGELEKDGIQIVSASELVKETSLDAGLLTSRNLSKDEEFDALQGWKISTKIGELDIGQSVICYQGTVLCVEAIEGTDECISRAGKLASSVGKLNPGKGPVLIKRCKPQQDRRLDLPTIGLKTIEKMKENGISALVLEARNSIILDLEQVLKAANQWGIAIRIVSEAEWG